MLARYPGIALFVRIVSWLAWVVAVGSALAGLVALIGGFAGGNAFTGFMSALAIWLLGLLYFAGLKVLPEVLTIFVDLHDRVTELAQDRRAVPPDPSV
jgi:hypothetical protein